MKRFKVKELNGVFTPIWYDGWKNLWSWSTFTYVRKFNTYNQSHIYQFKTLDEANVFIEDYIKRTTITYYNIFEEKDDGMKTIRIFYWATFQKYMDCKYEHNEELEYSVRKRNSLVSYFLDKGYDVMLMSRESDGDTVLTIAVDTKRFTQR